MNDIPFSTVTLLVGRQEEHPACKKLGVGLLVVTIWLDLAGAYCGGFLDSLFSAE